eukprot:TRINITY_DN1173_c0_g4_i5.p1 TRINITY_DN1173_c0_g4~~TRINITY_DN1173_c0_g4_i5.p1  ORF type:complete len:499 (+),score=123.68 TRINITY_DN1173_c0_g4_i5:746-2242(+)
MAENANNQNIHQPNRSMDQLNESLNELNNLESQLASSSSSSTSTSASEDQPNTLVIEKTPSGHPASVIIACCRIFRIKAQEILKALKKMQSEHELEAKTTFVPPTGVGKDLVTMFSIFARSTSNRKIMMHHDAHSNLIRLMKLSTTKLNYMVSHLMETHTVAQNNSIGRTNSTSSTGSFNNRLSTRSVDEHAKNFAGNNWSLHTASGSSRSRSSSFASILQQQNLEAVDAKHSRNSMQLATEGVLVTQDMFEQVDQATMITNGAGILFGVDDPMDHVSGDSDRTTMTRSNSLRHQATLNSAKTMDSDSTETSSSRSGKRASKRGNGSALSEFHDPFTLGLILYLQYLVQQYTQACAYFSDATFSWRYVDSDNMKQIGTRQHRSKVVVKPNGNDVLSNSVLVELGTVQVLMENLQLSRTILIEFPCNPIFQIETQELVLSVLGSLLHASPQARRTLGDTGHFQSLFRDIGWPVNYVNEVQPLYELNYQTLVLQVIREAM